MCMRVSTDHLRLRMTHHSVLREYHELFPKKNELSFHVNGIQILSDGHGSLSNGDGSLISKNLITECVSASFQMGKSPHSILKESHCFLLGMGHHPMLKEYNY